MSENGCVPVTDNASAIAAAAADAPWPFTAQPDHDGITIHNHHPLLAMLLPV